LLFERELRPGSIGIKYFRNAARLLTRGLLMYYNTVVVKERKRMQRYNQGGCGPVVMVGNTQDLQVLVCLREQAATLISPTDCCFPVDVSQVEINATQHL
jgi:hypothetical protein